jgi:hypothetical protein
MPRMPSSLRTMVRMLPAVAVALLALGVWQAQAQTPTPPAFPGIEVEVEAPEGDKQQLLLSDVENPEISGRYWVRSAAGQATPIDIARGQGISLRQVFEQTHTDLGFRSIKIQAPGGVIELSRRDVESPNFPPVFYLDAQGQVHFLVPSSGPTDYNDKKYFPIAGTTFAVTQTGGELAVKIKASRTKIEPGQSVTFTATATPSGSYRYDWTFEPKVGREDAGESVTHKFKKAGTYKVAVGVYMSESDTDSAGSAGVRIQVGDPKESDKDREGGGDNTDSGAPSSGTYSGDGGSYTPSYTPAPSVPSTPAPAPPPPPTPDPPDMPDIATSGTTVEGNLLADVSDPPPSNILESAARAARDGNPKDPGPDGGGVSEAAVGIAGVLALLGLGAGIETRQGRLPRLRLPRRGA